MEIEQQRSKYLSNRTKMTGFGETNEAAIREQMGKGEDSFTITVFRDFGDDNHRDTTESRLLFNRSKEGLYHFNSYQMRITNRPDDIAASTWETMKVNSDYPQNTYTLKELYNLKLGGSVEKTIRYDKKLDNGTTVEKSFTGFKKANHAALNEYDAYPLDHYHWPKMESELVKKLLMDPAKAGNLVKSLKKGNVQLVTLKSEDSESVRWIALDAQTMTIGIHEEYPRKYISNEMKEALKMEEEAKRLAAILVEGQSDLNKKDDDTTQIPPAGILPQQDHPDQVSGAKVDSIRTDGDLGLEVTSPTGIVQQDDANKVITGAGASPADVTEDNIFTRKLKENEIKVDGQNAALAPTVKEPGHVAGEGENGKGVPLKPGEIGYKPPKTAAGKKSIPAKNAKVTLAKKKKSGLKA